MFELHAAPTRLVKKSIRCLDIHRYWDSEPQDEQIGKNHNEERPVHVVRGQNALLLLCQLFICQTCIQLLLLLVVVAYNLHS